MPSCLVVDDSDVIRKVARRILEGLEFTVTEAANGLDGLEFCKKNMPDLVLVDWHMPGMSGIEFTAILRNTDRGTAPAIIYCTTENDPADIARALAAGANDYLMKPYDKTSIAAKVAAAA
jgi:two-component system, chemotaxis family, chemotaxis protein CheY